VIKIYLAKLTAGPLSESERLRCQELLAACLKLEDVGDIIVRNMLMHVRKEMKHGLNFTSDGWSELVRFHTVMAAARLAFNVLVSRGVETARQIVEKKDRLRDLEKAWSRSLFDRLSEGTPRSIKTSAVTSTPSETQADQLAPRLDRLSPLKERACFAARPRSV
jgi:phosphate:Na+ symporter